MSLQKINKKPFKSPFNNPVKNSASHPQNQIPLRKHEDTTQDQVMVKTLPQTEEVKPNIKRNTASNSRILQKNVKKREKKEKLPITSLTDTEYDDIFSSAINKAMTGGIPSPVMEHIGGSSGDEFEIENRVVIPKPDEAHSPHEVAEGPMEYITTKVQSQQTFSRKGRMAPFINANNCVSEAAQAKNLFSSKKRNFEDMQGVTRKKKVPMSTMKPNLQSLPVHPKKQQTLELQDQTDGSNKEEIKHANACQNFKTACKDNNNVPEMNKVQQNQSSKPQDNSSLQKSSFNEKRVNDLSQLSQTNSLQNQSGSHTKHSTQCSHHSQECGHVCKKKHAHNCSKLTQDSSTHQGTITQKTGSQSQCSQTNLSQPGPELSLKGRLLWLQERRDVGLWVQCSRPECNKWRYLHDIRDPVDIPQEWLCHMNSDNKFNSCALPEKPPTPLEEEDLIHNVYTAGSIVWGRLAGFPWWPAIVDDDPDTEQYYWLNGFSDIPTHYNVAFFDEKEVTRAWLTPGAIRPFRGNENSKEFQKTMAHGIDYAKRLQVARLQAQKALPMTTAERLRTFSFLARYKGPIGSIKKKKQQQDIKKHVENDGTYSQNTDEDEKLVAYRNLQEEEQKQKPKRKRAKQFNILKPPVKKIKGQAANNEGNNISEATDKVSKIDSNKAQENNSSNRPNQTCFSSSLYTQELSSKESENLNETPITDARSKPMQFESMNEISQNDTPRQEQNASSPTKPENVSLPKCKQPSTNNEIQETTDEMQSEDIINCSQDFFLSQVGPIEQNMSQKKKVDTYSGTTDVQGLNKSSISSRANCRNVNAPYEKNKASEITIDSCMATIGDTNKTEQIKATNSPIRVVEGNTGNMLGPRGALTDDTTTTEVDISIRSVLQQDISDPSASIAPTGSHSNCSDKVPLVPNSQFQTVHTKAGQLVDQNCDAVVPELNIEDFDNNSYDSVDFEPEE